MERQLIVKMKNWRPDNLSPQPNDVYTSSTEDVNGFCGQEALMKILGVSRNEIIHSHFLAWLFTNEATGEYAIKQLVTILRSEAGDIFPENFKLFFDAATRLESIYAKLEDPIEITKGKQGHNATACSYYGFADLVLDVRLSINKRVYIIIENKIDSTEHPVGSKKKAESKKSYQQTDVYAEYYINNYGKENCLFGYLTLTGADEPSSQSFIHVTYQELLDQILVPLLERVSDTNVLFRLKDYILCLESIDQEKGVMAVGPNLAEAAVDFWQRNKNHLKGDKKWENNVKELLKQPFFILTHILAANLRADINSDEEDIKALNNKLNSKDYTHYQINGEGNYSKNALVYEVVRRYVENNPNIILEDLQVVFSSNTNGLRGKKVVVSKFEYMSKKYKDQNQDPDITADKHWKLLSIKDGQDLTLYSKVQNEHVSVYVCQTGWDGQNLMDSFIDYVKNKKLFKSIEITKI